MSDTENQNQTDQTTEDQPRYYAELVEQILSELEGFFSSHLDDMFKQTDEYLFKAADEAMSGAEQTGLFECMNAVRDNKQIIQQGFIDELSTFLQPVSELEELPEKKQSKQNLTLGLIEQNEMDEMVTLTTISSKAAMDNSEAINHFQKRLKELSLYNDHIFHGEALEPKRLCDCMHEAVAETDLIDANKLIVYRFFNEALIQDLGELYETLNNLLIEQGILPEIDYSGVIPHYEAPAYEEEPVEEDPQQAPPQQGLPPGARRAFGSGMSGYNGGGAPQAPPMQGGMGGLLCRLQCNHQPVEGMLLRAGQDVLLVVVCKVFHRASQRHQLVMARLWGHLGRRTQRVCPLAR